MENLSIKIEADLGDTGLDAGDAIDAVITALTKLRDECYKNDDIDRVPRHGDFEGARGNFDGELVGHWTIGKR
jgi:hypothetical protein